MYKNQKSRTNTFPTPTHRRGFTLIELIVVMAVIGVLVLLAAPKFLNYTARARETQIRNDIKVLESKIDEYLIKHDTLPAEWGEAIPGDGQLYDRTGPIDSLPEGEFKVADKTFYPETNLGGDFYADSNGEVVYEEGGGNLAQEDNSYSCSINFSEDEWEVYYNTEGPSNLLLALNFSHYFVPKHFTYNEISLDGYVGEQGNINIPYIDTWGSAQALSLSAQEQFDLLCIAPGYEEVLVSHYSSDKRVGLSIPTSVKYLSALLKNIDEENFNIHPNMMIFAEKKDYIGWSQLISKLGYDYEIIEDDWRTPRILNDKIIGNNNFQMKITNNYITRFMKAYGYKKELFNEIEMLFYFASQFTADDFNSLTSADPTSIFPKLEEIRDTAEFGERFVSHEEGALYPSIIEYIDNAMFAYANGESGANTKLIEDAISYISEEGIPTVEDVTIAPSIEDLNEVELDKVYIYFRDVE